MKQFELTPAIQWLEDTYEARQFFDGNAKRDMFSIVYDHGCIAAFAPTCVPFEGWSEERAFANCNWERRDATKSHYFSSLTEEVWMDFEVGDDEDFTYALRRAAESPIYQAIAP